MIEILNDLVECANGFCRKNKKTCDWFRARIGAIYLYTKKNESNCNNQLFVGGIDFGRDINVSTSGNSACIEFSTEGTNNASYNYFFNPHLSTGRST